MSKTKNLLTPEFRVSFPNVFKPRKNDLNNKDEYSVVALFAKGADLTKLKIAYDEAVKEKWGDKPPKTLRKPFRNQGDRAKENEQGKMVLPQGYEDGAIYINLKSNHKPGVVNQKVEPIIEETEFYAGCYARATINAVAYEMKGNAGVSFYLQNIQKTKEGQPFGNLTKPEDDFAPIENAADMSTSDINDLL